MNIEKWSFEFPGAYFLDEQEENNLLDVLRNGSMFRYYGINNPSYVDKLESQAKKFYVVDYVLGINSGTGALITCMRALDIGPGKEVIIPSFMWVATVGAIIQTGAIPVLAEIDESFNIDPDDIERKITPNTGLIIPIHMTGASCQMDKIMAISKKYGIPVLEDCAQANGATFKGKKVGSFGDMGIFSLQLNKNITCGEGGMIVTSDEKLFLRAFSAHDMGLIRKDGRLATPEDYAIMWGAGRRMNEMCAAVACSQLTKLPKISATMRNSKQKIKNKLSDVEEIRFRKLPDPDGDSGPFIIFSLPKEGQAKKAAEYMKQAGLHNCHRLADYGLHIYYNIPSLTDKIPLSSAGNPWNLKENEGLGQDYNKGMCPLSDDLFERTILLPVPSCLKAEQEDFAAETIRKAIRS